MIKETKDLTEIGYESSNNTITVTSVSESTGLGESDHSNAVTHTVEGEYDIRPSADGTYAIFYGRGTFVSKSISIPEEYNGLLVEEIAENALEMTDVTEVTIPYTVKKIGYRAFFSCKSLETVIFETSTIADNDLIIEKEAFRYCNSFINVNLPKRLIKLGDSNFMNPYLSSVNFAPGCRLETIELSCFAYSGIKNITLPEKLKRIELQAFIGCALEEITIPASVEYIGFNAFSQCTSMLYAYFKDPRVWFASSTKNLGEGESIYLDESTEISVEHTASEMLIRSSNENYGPLRYFSNYHWYKLKKMPTPHIELNTTTKILSMYDPLGVADYFNIYANGKHKAQVYVDNSPGDSGSGSTGDSGDSLIGTWVFNDDPDLATTFQAIFNYKVELYNASSMQYDVKSYTELRNNGSYLVYWKQGDPLSVYGGANDEWFHGTEEYKRIIIQSEPTDETFKNWLKANATKIPDGAFPDGSGGYYYPDSSN